MPYIGTKIVNAEPMTRAAYNEFRGWQLPADENGADAGYLVEYLDGGKPNVPGRTGYISWSPAEQFEAAYRETNGMPFGHAVEALKKGFRLSRKGWNGKGLFIYLVPANSYPVQTPAAKSYFGADSMVPYNAYIAIKGADEMVSTWAPSIGDVLADDWEIVNDVML